MNYSLIAFSADAAVCEISRIMENGGVAMKNVIVTPLTKDGFKDAFDVANRAECVIIYGGQEPALKYSVKKMLAEIMGKTLVKNDKAIDNVEWYKKRNPLKSFEKKAYEQIVSFPDGFTCFAAGTGYLCGALSENGKKSVVLLPENLSDSVEILEKHILPVIKKKKSTDGEVYKFRLYGVTRIEIETKLSDIKKVKKLAVKVENDYTTDTVVTLTFAKGVEQEIIDGTLRDFCSIMGGSIYADRDITLAERAVELLTVRGKKVGTAESFTGGMVAAQLVSVAGASVIFDEGLVTYSNESKVERLGVSRETLAKYGAVSDQIAYEMALGLLSLGNDFAISTTGIAGPGGGSAEKPVGLCYVAVGSKAGIHVHKRIYGGNRQCVREQAVNDALFSLIEQLR